MKIFLSCTRSSQAECIISAVKQRFSLVGVGLAGIGEQVVSEPHYCGSSHPIMRQAWLDGSVSYPQSGETAHDALYRLAVEHGKLTVITCGALTDIALCLLSHPQIVSHIDKILVVGGTDSFGDITPAAERNFYNDPEAAQIVLKSGIPIVLFALNITRNAEEPWQYPLQYLENPQHFCTEPAGVYVETRGTVTLGKSVNDLYSDKQFAVKNVDFVTKIQGNL